MKKHPKKPKEKPGQSQESIQADAPAAIDESKVAAEPDAARPESAPPDEAAEKKRRVSRRTVVIISALALGLSLLTTGFVYYTDEMKTSDRGNFLIDDFKIARGVRVDGVELSGRTPAEAARLINEKADEKLKAFALTVNFDGQPHTFTAGELNVSTDAPDVVGMASRYANQGSYADRINAVEAAAQAGVEFDTKYQCDYDAVRAAALKATAQYSKSPVDATAVLSEGKFTYTSEAPGCDVDAEALAKAIAAGIESQGAALIEAPMKETQPKITEEELKANTKLIASYTTRDLGSANRAYNIKKLAGIVNGICILPGETWSINAEAGDRTVAAGWRKANGITSGRFVSQAGGGVCQVSTTLYNAAIRSELTIVERTPHTIKSTYVPIGLDATINSGAQDLKIRNDYDFPVYLAASVKGDKITCSVYGPPLKGYTVDFQSKQTGTIPEPAPKYIEATRDPDGNPIGPGEQRVWRQGRPGRTATVTKIYKFDDGTTKKEQFSVSKYPAYQAVIYRNSHAPAPSAAPKAQFPANEATPPGGDSLEA